MGKLIREKDWTLNPLGHPKFWPQSLKTCVRIVLTSRQPMFVWWGKSLINIYNDAYLSIIGGKHPDALGMPASEVWREIWDEIGPRAAAVMEQNEGTYDEALLLIMHRNGYPEETYYTFSYSPVPGDDGGTDGIICANSDDTQRIIVERQLRTLKDLGKYIIDCKTNNDVYEITMRALKENPQDFPFFTLYEINETGNTLTMAGGYPSDLPASFLPAEIDMLNRKNELATLYEVVETGKAGIVNHLAEQFGIVKGAYWDAPSSQFLIMPVKHTSQKIPYAVLGVGINPYRPLDEKYTSFFQLVADQIATGLANVHAYEEERKRAAALAEIDKAKTVFFSNISHEFRTPLTLILGPLEDLINTNDFPQTYKAGVETVHRNALRLLRLVNALLDFSRIESEKMLAKFQPIDLAEYTINLASNFRSIIEKAGLKLVIECRLSEPIYIDTEMWQKIIFNLLSNAFKYTLEGTITVTLFEENNQAVLKVTDTGVGIPEAELPRMFERFHRVQNSEGRTHEGTGIGLSLVHELVKLNRGSITVTSKQRVGSIFTVSIPLGKEHLPKSQVAEKAAYLTNVLPDVYANKINHLVEKDFFNDTETADETSTAVFVHKKARVLIVDDNEDMKSYIKSLLQKEYDIATAANGKEALEVLDIYPADVVISDVMMPVMDGIKLLHLIKNDAKTSRIPVILLSARAGEEAKIEGYELGADDYLVKPFSAKELVARVRSQISLSKKRDHAEKQLSNLFIQAPIAICIFKGPTFLIELANEQMLELWGKKAGDVLNKPLFEAMPHASGQGFEEILQNVYNTGQRFVAYDLPIELQRKGGKEKIYVKLVYEALRDEDGRISGIMALADDVTIQVDARKQIEHSEARQKLAIDAAKMGTFEWVFHTNKFIYSERLAQIFGYTETIGLTQKSFTSLIHPDDNAIRLKAHEEAFNTGVLFYELRFIWQDGTLHWIRLNGKVIYDDNNLPFKMYGTVLDVTEQKTLEDKLEKMVQERTRELKETNAQLEKSNHELGQYAYIASHDLQEPLRKIQIFSRLLQENLGDPKTAATYFDKINYSAKRMSELIKAVLNYSRLSKDGGEFVTIDLNLILENVKADFDLLIAEKNAVITSSQLPVINCIPLQITQLFYNLIGNSLKFSKQNPEIVISSATVPYTNLTLPPGAKNAVNYAEITFKDNGIGFDQQYAEQIFTIFQRLHGPQVYGGTGIGLALCRRITDNHNGFITVKSEPGKGATFYVYLPVY